MQCHAQSVFIEHFFRLSNPSVVKAPFSLWELRQANSGCLLLLLLLFRRAPRTLEGGPSERQHLLGVGREDSEWGRRATTGVLPEDIEIGAFLQPVFECLRLLLAQRARRAGCRIH